MKKILIPIFLLLAFTSQAQLNNSWIDYSKTYYKFSVGKTGLYHLNQSVLAAAGLGTAAAEQFQLWRNGEQVRIYTSVASGPLGSSDFIEFWGKINDGLPDKQLYKEQGFQLCDSFSLHTDTASYFLTINPVVSNNLRFTDAVNNVAGNTLTPDAYFMRSIGKAYRDQYNRGYAAIVGEYVYSASYDLGEGWTSGDAVPCCDIYHEFTNMNVYTAGPANSVSFYIAAFGNALYTRDLRVKFFNNIILQTPMNFFDTVKKQLTNLPLSLLQNPDYLQVALNGTSTNNNDRIVVGNFILNYPAKFNFNNQKNFYFELKPSSVGNFIVIDNFNTGGLAPVLYNLSDGSRYIGDISESGKVKFALPPSTAASRKYILVNQEASNQISINSIASRTFTDFSNTATQGDYIIISNPVLYNDGNGINYVDEYKQYRASVAGGSFNPKIYSIDELTDQFAFGIKKHPGAIRDFVRFADQYFAVKPKFLFLIGRGVTSLEYRTNETDPLISKLDLVPTFGWPASDILLACVPGTNVPLTPIGRLSVINGGEIKAYLNKVKQYEQIQASPGQTIADKSWMKNIIHVIGGSDSLESAQFTTYMDGYKTILEGEAYGGRVETFVKATTSAVEQANGERIQQLIDNGVGIIGYFGHSSANTLAFNLSSPELYNNQGKYPFFNISGCSAGNFFTFDPLRASGVLSISEKYVLADQRGSIGFLANTHLGIPPFLNFYNTELWKSVSRTMYGNTIGYQLKAVLQSLGGNPAALDFYTRIHLEEMNLHGDPAVRLNYFSAPDYVVEDPMVKISPNIVTVADNSFSLKVNMMNIGKALNDSLMVSIKRKLPNDSIQILFNQKIKPLLYADSLFLTVPINPLVDKGLNKIIVTMDPDNDKAELSETNNTVTKDFYIYEDEIRPVSPYNYSIVSTQNITYTASTANALSGQRQYLMEIDTTELFNSAFKKQFSASGVGGIVQFSPTNVTFTDSTVYYWRTSQVPLNGAQPIWNSFSFIYLANSSSGFNQSHYYQHLKSTYSNTIGLDADRVFRYKQVSRNLQIKTGLYPYTSYDRISVILDFDQYEQYGCYYGVLQFLVYDSVNLQPLKNYNVGADGRFGSWPVCSPGPDGSRYIFEFPYNNPVYRKRAMDFLDSIPSGYYVSITNLGWTANTSFISDWQSDQATLGTGNSLYHKLKAIGFTKIDSFTRNLPFIYFYRKNTPSYAPQQLMGATESDQLAGSFIVNTKYKTGTIESPSFGPAKRWTALHWRGKTNDPAAGDSVNVQVYGIKANGVQDLLATVRPATDTSLSFINAVTYPNIKLKMNNSDNYYATPNQLNYWRINADYIPEGAVAPNILFRMKDTVEQGEKIDFALAFKNISGVAFDSLKIKFVIIDQNNVSHPIVLPRGKALIAGDTMVISYSIDTRDYTGLNTLNVMVNPDLDQPEQYLSNNFIFKDFFVKGDKINPLLDVTFDGIHILNHDLVASKPHILVKLKDESRFVALNDTSLLKVMVRYPDGSYHNYFFGDSMQFTPATLSGGDNTASIDFLPSFPDNGDYELVVSGKDRAGNKAGNIEYRILFSVENKPMISNMLNYPNPFTTSTAFVFTITGSEVPQNVRIQILTITGKVVREITKAELGDLHIGRNITDFKWDGTDSYGQKLANGVYLYRMITNLNGKSLDSYNDLNDKIITGDGNKAKGGKKYDFFVKGYGKMYLMR